MLLLASLLLAAAPVKVPLRTAPSFYPPLARLARIQGSVVFELAVAPDGTVQKVRRLEGPPHLAFYAQDMREWRYAPSDSERVITTRVEFVIRKKPCEWHSTCRVPPDVTVKKDSVLVEADQPEPMVH
jgi:hypothetical protein